MRKDTTSVHALFKLGRAEHMRRFRELGEVYMKPLDFYRKLEKDQQRGDPYEGVSALWQPSQIGELRIGDHAIPPSDLAEAVRFSRDDDRTCAVFCMGAITGSSIDRHLRLGAPLVDPRNLEFGDTAIAITKMDPFLHRFRTAVERTGLGFATGTVEYLSVHAHDGEWGPFRKDQRFEHQQEWRLVVRNPPSDPFVLSLGSLEDCTIETTTETLLQEITAEDRRTAKG